VLTDAEKVMMSYARQVAVDASRVEADDIERLKAHCFSDEEIFDIAATAAARSFFTKVLDGLGAQADSAFSTMDQTLNHALTVGRPIDTNEVERLQLT
jgi:hypothetical protein